ncbi:unnamed protein product [Aphanomyces euteiches]
MGGADRLGSFVKWKVHHSSKDFELSEDGTALKALTRGQYKLVLFTQKTAPPQKLLLDVFINNSLKHEYRLEKNESQSESTVTMEIPLHSNLRLYVSFLGTSASLNWLFKKV